MAMKEKLDPDGEVLAKVGGIVLGGLLAASLWFVFRISDGNLLMVVGGGFVVMAVYGESRWKDKIKITLLMSFYSGLMQFFIAMLLNDRFLLLGFIFAFTFALLYYWPNRVAASITLAIGSIGIAQQAGFQPGMTRFINQMLTGGCALAAMAIIEYLLTSWRIHLVLQQYTLALREQLRLLSDSGSVPEAAKIRSLAYAGKANQLLAGQRFLFHRHKKTAIRALIPLEHLHVISRAIILLENTAPDDLEHHAETISQLEKELTNTATRLRYGMFATKSAHPLEENSCDSRAGRALAIIAGEMAAIKPPNAKPEA